MKARSLALTSLLAVACVAPLTAQSYTFQTILECNNLTAFPVAMNGSGVVVGTAHNIFGPGAGMIYYNGTCQTYDEALFYGISDTDWLLASPLAVSVGNTYFLVEPGGTPVELPTYPDAQGTDYCCMDTATGVLAGNYYQSVGGGPLGFLYQNGTFTALPSSTAFGDIYGYTITALNNTGITVGYYEGPYPGTGGIVGFAYSKGKATLLSYPGATFTYFYGINDYGVIVGAYTDNTTGASNVVLYNLLTGKWTNLDFAYPYDDMTPVGISNAGVIALQYSPSGGMVIATPPSNKPN
jgi:hypothetical protein